MEEDTKNTKEMKITKEEKSGNNTVSEPTAQLSVASIFIISFFVHFFFLRVLRVLPGGYIERLCSRFIRNGENCRRRAAYG